MNEVARYPKRLIEVDLPIKRISAHARREKSIRHGHISTLHIWWARRPLASCRAVILAALWPDPADPLCPASFREQAAQRMKAFRDRHGGKQRDWNNALELRQALLDFIADFANWDNATDSYYLETSRTLVQAAHMAVGDQSSPQPLVLDPFAGGGAIPLEALRVGADAFASDLNPVAVLLNKVVLEFVPKYGQRLADEVRRWGAWIKEQAERELAEYYPHDADGSVPSTYLWCRTIRCEGPGCGSEIPLIRSLLLAKRGSRAIALKLVPDPNAKFVHSEIIDIADSTDFVEGGTLRRGSATCPACGYTVPAPRVRAQFSGQRGGTDSSRLLAVVCETKAGKCYRQPTKNDYAAIAKAREQRRRIEADSAGDALKPIPDEPLPYLRSIFNINLLDVHRWGDLFSARQALAIIAFNSALTQAMHQLGDDTPMSRAVATMIALAIDRQADYCTSICTWVQSGEYIGHNFAQGQSLPIKWDYAEVVPFASGSGNWDGAIDWVARVVVNVANSNLRGGQVVQASATDQVLPDDSVSALITDPPYYDAIPYADLSDFFYVWLRRSVGVLYPHLFSTDLTPKRQEIVQLAERNAAYSYKTKHNFERMMREALTQGKRLTQTGGIGVFIFAHKETTAWETMLQAVIDAGWVVTASWPIDTEMEVRLRAKNAAALASSVHLVCRPRVYRDDTMQAMDVGDWRDVLAELPKRIHEWMPRLAAEGVAGADAIFACLGPALEIFSRYVRVERASGEVVLLKEYLEHVWAAVASEALSIIFKDADATGFEEDARLTAMWLWTLSTSTTNSPTTTADEDVNDATDDSLSSDDTVIGKSAGGSYYLEFDAARKIAQGLGVHLDNLIHVVQVKGETARLWSVNERSRYLFGKDNAQAPATNRRKAGVQLSLFTEYEPVEEDVGWGDKVVPTPGTTALDRVHQAMILFAVGRAEAMKRFLVEEGVGNDMRFWRLAQSLSALYPAGSEEKRWVDGVLARKKGLGF